MAKKQTSVRVDPEDIDRIQGMVDRGEITGISDYVRIAVKEKLSETRVAAEIDPEVMTGIRRLVDLGMYDGVETFTREAVLRLFYSTKDQASVKEAIFRTFLEDHTFKDAMRDFIHEVFVEGFRPPPKPGLPPG